MADENLKVVSERLGHATVVLTLDTYSHVLPTMQQRASSKLESLLYRKTSAKGDCGTFSAHNQLEKALDADVKSLKSMEAATGIEPTDKGFAVQKGGMS